MKWFEVENVSLKYILIIDVKSLSYNKKVFKPKFQKVFYYNTMGKKFSCKEEIDQVAKLVFFVTR
jgi:hypothetical protein